MRFTAALELRTKELLDDKVSLSALKDTLARNKDQTLYSNIGKLQIALEALRKSKLDATDLSRLLMTKADKQSLDSKVNNILFKAMHEQLEFRINEILSDVRLIKSTTQHLERTTSAALAKLAAGDQSRGLSALGRIDYPLHMNLRPPTGGTAGSVSFAAMREGMQKDLSMVISGGTFQRKEPHQPERTVSPKRQMSKKGLTGTDVKQSKSENAAKNGNGKVLPVPVMDSLMVSVLSPQLPSLSPLVFKMDQEEFKSLKAASEKEGKPLVQPRPPRE